jgi:hypothetical protein
VRQVFRDEKHEQLFRKDGYLRVNVFNSETIARIEKFFLENSEKEFSGIHISLELGSTEQKAKIHSFLSQVFDEHLSNYFRDYKALTSNFLSKKPDAGSVMYPHQDWCFVNEVEHSSLNLWFPLCDTNEQNGALALFKGSHRLQRNIRGTNIPPNLDLPARVGKYQTIFHLKAGEVLMYDHRVVHSSAPNRSDKPRPAASISIIPVEATPIHYLGDKHRPSQVLELEVDEKFYHNYRMERGYYQSPEVNQTVSIEGYRYREIQLDRTRLDREALVRLYEPRGIRAFRQMKEKFKSKLSLG